MTAGDQTMEQIRAEIAELERRLEAHESALEVPPIATALPAKDGGRLIANEARYHQLVETAREGICITDEDGRCMFANRRLEEIFGFAAGEMRGGYLPELTGAHGLLGAEDLLLRHCGGGAEHGEIRARHRDGHEVWIELATSPILGEAGHPAGTLVMVLDHTARHLAEDQLRKSEAQLRQSQDAAHIGSWEWDLRTDVVTRSPELCRIFGKSEEELGRGRMPEGYDYVHEDDRARVRAELEGAIARRRSYAVDFRILRPDGVAFIHSRGLLICDDAGNAIRVLGTAQDVTERKMVEARLMLADRMSSVGTLAAGMAHEINNPLAYIVTNLDLVAEEIGALAGVLPPERLAGLSDMIGQARQGSERIRKIVRGLKAFSRADEERRVLVDVRDMLDAAASMAFNEVRHRAQLVKDYRDVPLLSADEGQLAQVFVNVLVNAAQAIVEGRAETNEIRIATSTDEAGRAVVEVADTGPGIPPEVLGRIFDPFFTTKPVGVGTGLGLSICHGLVTALGGEITVASQPGQGTVFRIVLPPAPAEATSAEAPRAPVVPAPPVAAKRGTILVVDDDARVGGSLQRVLRAHDVTVLLDAREALRRIAAGDRYDVILCDLMMPQMSGMDLHAEVERAAPEQAARMLFVTGGAFTEAAIEFLHRVPNERIDKPFDAQSLRAVVERYLR